MTKPETEWVLVPRCPTMEMVDAGFSLSRASEIWSAMLSAAPLAPSAPLTETALVKEWTEQDIVANLIRGGADRAHANWYASGYMSAQAALTAQATAIEGLTETLEDEQAAHTETLRLWKAAEAALETARVALTKADAVIWAYERGTGHWSFNSQAPLINADKNAAIERHISRPFAALPLPALPKTKGAE